MAETAAAAAAAAAEAVAVPSPSPSLAKHDTARVLRTATEFEYVYAAQAAAADGTGAIRRFDHVQWTDSFSLQQIAVEHMSEWQQLTVQRIMRARGKHRDPPRRLYEIGSGTGLLLMELLQDAALVSHADFSYVGVELSSACVEGLKKRVDKFEPAHATRVKLWQGAAHEVAYDAAAVAAGRWFPTAATASSISHADSSLYDIAIINSVALYFPSRAYLRAVLSLVVAHCADGGAVFVGDHRDSRTLHQFYLCIAMHRDHDLNLESAATLAAIDRSAANDPHLLLSPMEFIRMARDVQPHRIHGMLLQPKLSSHSYRLPSDSTEDQLRGAVEPDNEMNRFRFDVTFAIAPKETNERELVVNLPLEPEERERKISKYNYREVIAQARMPQASLRACADAHPSRLQSFFSSLLAKPTAAAVLFSYPHVPVLYDSLVVDAAMDREQWTLNRASSSVSAATAAARLLLTPRQLLACFEGFDQKRRIATNAASASTECDQWSGPLSLELTLDPCDATSLLCIISPAHRSLVVRYGTESAADSVASLHQPSDAAVSSQSFSSAAAPGLEQDFDVVSGFTHAMWRRFNAPTSALSLQAGQLCSLPQLFWTSAAAQITAGRGDEIAVRQVLDAAPAGSSHSSALSDRILSWRDLARQVWFASDFLRSLGVHPGQRVLQCVDRSLEQVVGMLAILSVGASYVPLAAAPTDPAHRIARIIADSGARAILTQAQLRPNMQQASDLARESDAMIPVPVIVCLEEALTPASLATSRFGSIPPTELAAAAQEALGVARVDSRAEAYAIYTSGSTGAPKAVPLTSLCMVHLMHAFQQRRYGPVNSGSGSGSGGLRVMRMLQTTGPSFDLHVYEVLAPLLAAALAPERSNAPPPVAQLVLLRPGGHQDLEFYVHAIATTQVTHVVCTPSLLRLIGEQCTMHNCWPLLQSVRIWRTGGEALPQKLVESVLPRFRAQRPEFKLVCSYGPAEATDTATVSEAEVDAPRCLVTESSHDAFRFVNAPPMLVSIGGPLPFYAALVLVESELHEINSVDAASIQPRRHLRAARPGEVGMLYLAGSGLFSGYIGRADLTRAALIPTPLHLRDCGVPSMLYRTGDLASLFFTATVGSEGAVHGSYSLHFQGRVDFAQVKLRGQRIEVGEIEAALATHPLVQAAAVSKRADGGDDYLAAYIIAAQAASAGPADTSLRFQLWSLLRSLLPSHMVPSSLTIMAAFPTNRNGKADRALLPKPDSTDFDGAADASPEASDDCPKIEDAAIAAPADPTLLWLRGELAAMWLGLLDSGSSGSDDPLAHPAMSFEMYAAAAAAPTTVSAAVVDPVVLNRSWLESGGSSLHLMRFLSLLRRFVTAHRANSSADLASQSNALLLFPRLYRLRTIENLAVALRPLVRHPKDAQEAAAEEAEAEATAALAAAAPAPSDPSSSASPPSAAAVSPADAAAASPDADLSLDAATAPAPDLPGLHTIRPPLWASPANTHASCPQQTVTVMDEIFRFWEQPKAIYNSPYVIRMQQAGTVDGATFTRAQAQRMLQSFESLLHRLLQSQPTLRVCFSFDGSKVAMRQHVFELDQLGYEDAARFHTTVVRRSNEEASTAGWNAEDEMSLAESDRLLPPLSPLALAIRDAAQTPLIKVRESPHAPAFRFSSFVELDSDSSASGSAESSSASDDVALVSSLHVMLSFHHAVFDGESIKIVLDEIVRLARGGSELPPQTSYFAQCAYVSGPLYGPELGASMHYWIDHLADWDPASHVRCQPYLTADGLATDAEFTTRGRKLRSRLSDSQFRRLQSFGRKHDCTSYVILLTVFYLSLHCSKLDNQERFAAHPLWAAAADAPSDEDMLEDLSVGSAMSNRQVFGSVLRDADFSRTACVLANCTPFRMRFRARATTPLQLLQRTRELVLEHLLHQAVSYGVLIPLIDMTQGVAKRTSVRGPCRNAFFSSCFLYEDLSMTQSVRAVPLGEQLVDLHLLELPDFGCIFELQLKINEVDASSSNSDGHAHGPSVGGLTLTFEYAEQLFSDAAVRLLDRRMHWILDELLLSSDDAAASSSGSIAEIAARVRAALPLRSDDA